MATITTTKGREFSQIEGQSLLVSSQEAGFSFPYSCRTGRCSSCKLKVINGDTKQIGPELGLSKEEEESGWILSCVRAAATDIVVEAEDLGNHTLFPSRTLPARIDEMALLNKDVMRVSLRFPPGRLIEFYPGQYVEITGAGGITRSYSVANAPQENNKLEFHIKNVSGGVLSEYWFGRAQEDDLVHVHGAIGTFFLREVVGRRLVFLATGTGIAPVKAMLEGIAAMAEEERPSSVIVYWGARAESDLYCHLPEFEFEFRCEEVLSQPSSQWSKSIGYVQDAMLREFSDFAGVKVYACGSDEMIRSARSSLLAAGLSSDSFYSDAFVASS